MKYEKMCYAFVGCIVAGSIIQDNMNLPWPCFPLMSLGLWAICVGVQWYSFRWTQKQKLQQDGQKLDKHNKELERIISTFENCSSQQLEQLKNEMNLLRTIQEDENKKILGRIQNLDASINHLKNEKVNGIRDIVAFIGNVEEKGKSTIQDVASSLANLMKEHLTHIGKLMVSSQENYLEQFSTMQKSLELIRNNTLEMTKLENGILSSQDSNKMEVEDCINNSTNAIISNNEALLGEVIQSVSKIDSEIEAIYEMRDAISTALSEVKDILNGGNGEVIREIKAISDDVKGILTNLQTTIDCAYQVLTNIEKLDDESRGLIEDANNKLSEVIEEIPSCANQVLERLTEGIDRQFEVISHEESILEKYDEVLRLINDDVVVKMVNDSNNLLICMRDCYNLLENIRRNKK